MQSASDLSSGKRSMGSSKDMMPRTNSELREVSNDCATLLPMIQGTDCRKYDEKHENHVLYKIRNRKIISFYWENIQLQTWSIQYQIILWHYFSVPCCSGQALNTGISRPLLISLSWTVWILIDLFKKDKTKETSLFLRPEVVSIQDPCQLYSLSISQMWHCLALQFSVCKEKSDSTLT